MRTRLFLFMLVLAAGFSISCNQVNENSDSYSIQEIDSPAGSGSGEPNLFVSDDGRIFLSWIESEEDKSHSLRFSFLENDYWTPPLTISRGNNWFVNWADFPSLVVFPNGNLAAHWLAKSGEDTYAYDVKIALSGDRGKSWSEPIIPHRDGTETEHGFVSILPWEKDQLFAVWLDGRNYAKTGNGAATNEMSLRFAMIDPNGKLTQEQVLDNRACDCCPTSAIRTPNGALVVYRDRSENEVRDIYLVRFENGNWSEPVAVHNDGWEIKGCPVNGAALAVDNDNVAVAWFTMANQTPQVRVAFLREGGAEFGAPIAVDDGDPMGRVDAILLPDGSALVSWMEAIDNNAEIRIRRVQPDGSAGESFTVTQSSKARASGFPRMVRNDDQICFAWTEAGEPPVVRTAVMNLSSL